MIRKRVRGPMRGAPVAIDLFAGAGGLSEGLQAAGINVAVAFEKHPHAALTYAFNHPDTTVLCGEIRNADLDRVEAILEENTGRSEIDIIAGGPPCQGYSPAGKRRKNDRRNGLYETFLEFVSHFQPKMVLFENVPGFADFDGGSTVKIMLSRLWKLGYEVAGFDRGAKTLPEELPILDASRFGVPQRRRRFLLVAWHADEVAKDFEWPGETHGVGIDSKRLKLVTVEDALDDLAFLTAGFECHAHPKKTNNAYQLARRNGCDRIFNHLATKHRKTTVNMYRRLSPGDTIRSIPEKFRTGKQTILRLAPTEISKAVLALPDDLVHYSRLRIPTVREMARLQSFDDDYVFLGKRTTSDLGRRIDVPQYTQVGNAVPPLLAKRSVGPSCVRLVTDQRISGTSWNGANATSGYAAVQASWATRWQMMRMKKSNFWIYARAIRNCLAAKMMSLFRLIALLSTGRSGLNDDH